MNNEEESVRYNTDRDRGDGQSTTFLVLGPRKSSGIQPGALMISTKAH